MYQDSHELMALAATIGAPILAAWSRRFGWDRRMEAGVAMLAGALLWVVSWFLLEMQSGEQDVVQSIWTYAKNGALAGAALHGAIMMRNVMARPRVASLWVDSNDLALAAGDPKEGDSEDS